VRKPQDREKKGPILIRIDPDMLWTVDAAAKRKGVNRTRWMLYQIGEALENNCHDNPSYPSARH